MLTIDLPSSFSSPLRMQRLRSSTVIYPILLQPGQRRFRVLTPDSFEEQETERLQTQFIGSECYRARTRAIA